MDADDILDAIYSIVPSVRNDNSPDSIRLVVASHDIAVIAGIIVEVQSIRDIFNDFPPCMQRDVGSRDIRKNDLLSKINVFIPPCEDNISRDGRNVDFRFADTLSPLDDLGFGSDRSVLSDIESDSQTAQAFRILSDIGDVFINIGKTRTPTRKSILLAIGPIGTGRCLPIIGGIVSPSDAIVSFQDRAVVVDPCDRVGLLSKGLPSGHEIQIGLDRSRCREKPVRLLHSRIPP